MRNAAPPGWPAARDNLTDMHRNLRILILLLVLLAVAGTAFLERLWVRGWTRPLQVAIYPVAMDAASEGYLAQLRADDFAEVAAFIAGEAQRTQKKSYPAPRIRLQAPLRMQPPLPQGQGALANIRFTLRLRAYAFRHTPFWASLGTVRLFVLYHDVARDEALPHSLGLQKGLLGVVHAFASAEQRAQNNVVIAHELLHTLGATDKYGRDGQPLFPIGYADTYLQPLHPQQLAEIMAGRIPLSASRSEMPRSLAETVIGYQTAAEIGW
jgi:hypothetical protein